MKRLNYYLAVLACGMFFAACSDDDVDPNLEAYNKASAIKGGIMFDNYWSEESGFDTTNPNTAKFKAYSDFFRCKQCHGWDLLGSQGYYNNRAPKKNRPNVSDLNLAEVVKTKTYKELFDAMKTSVNRRDISFDPAVYDPATNPTEGDKMPNYSQFLSDAQLWDLVKFMKEGVIDVTQLYDAAYTGTYPTGKTTFSNIGKDGFASRGNTLYADKCVKCHGADGKKITLEGSSLGKFLRSKPNEVQHKVKFGQLGTAMEGEFEITVDQMKDLYKACADPVNFPD